MTFDERLAAIRTVQIDDTAHHSAVAPGFLDGFQDLERLDLVARRRVVGDELGLVLHVARAVHERVIVRDQPLQPGLVAVDLRLVVILDRFRKIGR